MISLLAPSVQSHFAHRSTQEQLRQLKQTEFEQQTKLHGDALQHDAQLHTESAHNATKLHAASMELNIKLAQREATRDVWIQRSMLNQTMLVVNTLLFACAFEALSQGVVPLGTPTYLLYCIAVSYGAALLMQTTAIILCSKLQARNGSFHAIDVPVLDHSGQAVRLVQCYTFGGVAETVFSAQQHNSNAVSASAGGGGKNSPTTILNSFSLASAAAAAATSSSSPKMRTARGNRTAAARKGWASTDPFALSGDTEKGRGGERDIDDDDDGAGVGVGSLMPHLSHVPKCNCNHRHMSYNSFYLQHCERLRKYSFIAFQVGSLCVLCAALTLQTSKFTVQYKNTAAAIVFAALIAVALVFTYAIAPVVWDGATHSTVGSRNNNYAMEMMEILDLNTDATGEYTTATAAATAGGGQN